MRHAVVVGAGIGGLAAALALHRTGWEVTVLERAPELGAVGAGLTLWPNAMRALDALKLGDAVRDRSVRIGDSGGLREPGGRLVVRTTEQMMTDLRALHRADLHAVLIGALPAGMVRTASPVSSVEDGGTVVLADGERITAELVVGADGVDSAVRRAFWSDRPRYRGYTAWRGVTPPGAVRIGGGVVGETWGRGTRFGIVGLNGDRTYWFAVANAEPGVRYDDEWAEVRRRFGSWHDPIPALLDATDHRGVLHHDIVDLAPLKSYVAGRVVLLGDAAHAMTPDVGQGGCQALEDAVVLAARVASADLAAGLARYDAERRSRTRSIARLARRIGRFAQADGRLVVALRTQLLRLAPPRAAERVLDRITRWIPPAVRTSVIPTHLSGPPDRVDPDSHRRDRTEGHCAR